MNDLLDRYYSLIEDTMADLEKGEKSGEVDDAEKLGGWLYWNKTKKPKGGSYYKGKRSGQKVGPKKPKAKPKAKPKSTKKGSPAHSANEVSWASDESLQYYKKRSTRQADTLTRTLSKAHPEIRGKYEQRLADAEASTAAYDKELANRKKGDTAYSAGKLAKMSPKALQRAHTQASYAKNKEALAAIQKERDIRDKPVWKQPKKEHRVVSRTISEEIRALLW